MTEKKREMKKEMKAIRRYRRRPSDQKPSKENSSEQKRSEHKLKYERKLVLPEQGKRPRLLRGRRV